MGEYWNIALWEYGFYEPKYFWLLLLVPVYFIARLYTKNNLTRLRYSRPEQDLNRWKNVRPMRLRLLIAALESVVLAFLLLVFTRPHHDAYHPPRLDFTKGIDIVLAIDASASMLAQDFQPNRLEVAKRVAQTFVKNRIGDRIGLVVYEGEAYTACPPTVDYTLLQQQIRSIQAGYLKQGTAVGEGLGVAVSRLRSDSLRSKVILLLTDGSNNAGNIDPLTAAELAKSKNCKVYTIGIGTRGLAPTPVMTPMGIMYENLPVEIDEGTLMAIAQKTNGAYYRATDESNLKAIYQRINQLETRSIQHEELKKQQPLTLTPLLIWALVLCVVVQALKFLYFPLYEQ